MHFDMNRAWSDGIAMVGANFSLLAVLGGVFFFIPAMLMFVAMPDAMEMMMTPGADPEQMSEAFADAAPTFFGVYFLIALAGFVGYSAMIALMGDNRRVTVGQAIAIGFKTLLPLVGVLVLAVVAYLVVALVAGLLLGLVVAGLSAISAGLGVAVAMLLGVILFGIAMWLLTRVSMTLPAVALEGVLNPVAALRRSWALTKPAQRRLFTFYALLFAAYLVIALVLFMIMGLIATALGAPSALGFLNGIAGALVAMVFSGLVVAIYNQLAGPRGARLEETFE